MKNVLEQTGNDAKQISPKIIDFIRYECTRYRSKGHGLIFAWILALLYIKYFPEFLKFYWPKQVINEGLFYFLTTLGMFYSVTIFSNLEYMLYYKLNHPFFERYKTCVDQWPWERNPHNWAIQLKKTLITYSINLFIILPLALSIDAVL